VSKKGKDNLKVGSMLRRCMSVWLLLALFTVVTAQNITRQTAINAFTRNDYKTAYSQFSELLSNFPGDPLYKYYCGACLVGLEKDPTTAVRLLTEASNESSTVRSVPPDCQFFLGRALQLSGKFSEAADCYSRFVSLAGKKVSRELNVADFIRQCEDKRGAVETGKAEEIIPEPKTEVSIPAVQNAGVKQDSLPAEYDNLLRKALENRIMEDSLLAVPENRKKNQPRQKDSVSVKISAASNKVLRDSARIKTQLYPLPDSALRGSPVFSDFSIDGKTVYKPYEKVAVDPAVPAGLIYRIQLAVFRNPVQASYFKGITPIQGFRNPSTGVTTYYAGRFRRSSDAGQALIKVKAKGFRDAFVIALMDRNAISPERAAILEKQWHNRALFMTVKTDTVAAADTVPPTLVFRVEVRRTVKPLPEDQLDVLRTLAAGKGFDIVKPEPKKNIYLIGRFLTYKSAAEYADLLIRNGYKEARVVAWMGKKEIPVETARQLFGEHEE
jgi:hypothetical protein